MTPETADVAIVGAGPAGAYAAFMLARAGARVTMFDSSHPREKPCGGGVTRRALDLAADAIDIGGLPARNITQVRFLHPHGEPAIVTLSDGIVVASRTAFDTALLDAACRAGATLVRARVVDVSREARAYRLATTAGPRRCDLLVGADGANSLVRRRVARPFSREELSIATGYFAHGVTSDEIVIELAASPAGYFWSFPRPDHLAIGICAQADEGYGSAALRTRTTAWIDANDIAPGARLQSYSWPIPSLRAEGFDRLSVAGDRWALIGDAAGLVDPLTREGILYALLSARELAHALAAGVADREYSSRMRDHAIPELRRAAVMKASFFRPAFTALLMQSLQHSPPIRAIMADLITGCQPYAGLRWRLFKTLEARLAWRALRAIRRAN